MPPPTRTTLLLLAVLSFQTRAAPPNLTPYPHESANRLHSALFLRTTPAGQQHIHHTDPLLYQGGKHLLEGESHQQALAALDHFLNQPPPLDKLHRLALQRDLWAAFDYLAWYPDDWVHPTRHEPAAKALRTRLAKAIKHLALDARELETVPDNYSLAIKSNQFPKDHDPQHPDRPFLPDLFNPAGPWVRFHQTTAEPMTPRHFEAAGGRAAHLVFLRLPTGRAATEEYLNQPNRQFLPQFPEGTMLAMVRKALAIDRANKIRPTPITELVQIRVYNRIPQNPRANMEGDFGQQHAHEFLLDRLALFQSKPGLRPVTPDELPQPFPRNEGDPYAAKDADPHGQRTPALQTCIQCHQAPGQRSVLSMTRTLSQNPLPPGQLFRTYNYNVELNYTSRAKTQRYDWGLLQGLLESQ